MSDLLHSCLDCGHQISKRASLCPHCGAPSAVAPTVPAVAVRSGVGDGVRIGMGLLPVGLVVVLIISMFNSVDAEDRLVVTLTVTTIISVTLFALYRKGKKAMERDRQATGALK